MSNMQKTLESLQPYVIGIRYLDGNALVDVVFKDGWTLIDSDTVKKVKGDDGLNYYMLLANKDGVGLDDLLQYVELVIKLNLEREKKHELLKEKANELKELFKKNSLDKLKRLKFVIGDEELVPDLNEFEIDLGETQKLPSVVEQKIIEEPTIEDIVEIETNSSAPTQLLDEEGKVIPLTEEELEMIEEEARAKRNIKLTESIKNKGEVKKINNKKIELPPKKLSQPQSITSTQTITCDCQPDEACSKCIDTKY